jgi:hypothetical protein
VLGDIGSKDEYEPVDCNTRDQRGRFPMVRRFWYLRHRYQDTMVHHLGFQTYCGYHGGVGAGDERAS